MFYFFLLVWDCTTSSAVSAMHTCLPLAFSLCNPLPLGPGAMKLQLDHARFWHSHISLLYHFGAQCSLLAATVVQAEGPAERAQSCQCKTRLCSPTVLCCWYRLESKLKDLQSVLRFAMKTELYLHTDFTICWPQLESKLKDQQEERAREIERQRRVRTRRRVQHVRNHFWILRIHFFLHRSFICLPNCQSL